MRIRSFGITLAVCFAATALGCKSMSSSNNAKLDPAPAVKPSPAVLAMAQDPTPPPTATKKAVAGGGQLAVNTTNSAGDQDAYWVASMDIDSDGAVEETQCLLDEEDGVLYLYSEDDIPCKGGGTCKAALLIALNCKGNPRNATVGSGWCAVYLDKGECGADEAGIFACRFDRSGNVTAWAAAKLDEKNDDVDIVAVEVTK
jgi:hypothetical protein